MYNIKSPFVVVPVVDYENPPGDWLLLSCISVSLGSISSTCTHRNTAYREQFHKQNGVKEHVKRRKWCFNYVSLHKSNFSSNLNHYKYNYLLISDLAAKLNY